MVIIILVNWNGRDVTLDCLGSLHSVTYSPFRIVVVDNGSTDGSVEAIRSRFPDVTVLTMGRNLRFAGGNNAGIRHALDQGAEAVLLLNNDTTVEKEFLDHLVKRLNADAATGATAPKILYHDDPRHIWFAGGGISFWTGTMRHTGIREVDRGQYNTARAIAYASGCCILVKRSVIERIGLLDESFFMYAEDADWSMRIRKAGFVIMYEPASRVRHKLSVSAGGHVSLYKMRHKFVSNLRFFFRHAAWYQWLVFPWLNIIVNGWAAFRYFAGGRR
jgi:GT2 family glycosyltransferase